MRAYSDCENLPWNVSPHKKEGEDVLVQGFCQEAQRIKRTLQIVRQQENVPLESRKNWILGAEPHDNNLVLFAYKQSVRRSAEWIDLYSYAQWAQLPPFQIVGETFLSFQQKKVLEKLNYIYEQCSRKDWGGEEEDSVSYITYKSALSVLKTIFKNKIYIDNIAPAADGSVGFNWRTSVYSIYLHVQENDFVYTRLERTLKAHPFILAGGIWEFSKHIKTMYEDIIL